MRPRAMIGGRQPENRSNNAVAGVHRRSGSLSPVRRRHETDSFRPAFHACATRARVQKEVFAESTPARTKAKGQAFGLDNALVGLLDELRNGSALRAGALRARVRDSRISCRSALRTTGRATRIVFGPPLYRRRVFYTRYYLCRMTL